MKETITINYPNGRMILNLEEFFPMSNTKLRKLIKSTINTSEEREDVMAQIRDYLAERIRENCSESEEEHYKMEADRWKAKAAEYDAPIARAQMEADEVRDKMESVRSKDVKKYWKDQYKILRDRVLDLKDDRKLLTNQYKSNANFCVRIQKNRKKLEENLELVKSYMYD